MKQRLTTSVHDRNSAGLNYVYPVLSRRAGGLSIGVNLSTNNACNWRCIYCQVPDLVRGSAPDIDLKEFHDELVYFIDGLLNQDFFERFGLDGSSRVIKDIAISGNGEPTSSKVFALVVQMIGKAARQFDLLGKINLVLITNGSLCHQSSVQAGLLELAELGGEAWFKLDSATVKGRSKVNDVALSNQRVTDNLLLCNEHCPTWIQTCWLKAERLRDEIEERKAYLDFLKRLRNLSEVRGVMLYTLARPSLQPEFDIIEKVSANELEDFANAIRQLDYVVKVSA